MRLNVILLSTAIGSIALSLLSYVSRPDPSFNYEPTAAQKQCVDALTAVRKERDAAESEGRTLDRDDANRRLQEAWKKQR